MVSLREVLEDAGFDITSNPEDMSWFMSKASEFEELLEEVEARLDEIRELEYEELDE